MTKILIIIENCNQSLPTYGQVVAKLLANFEKNQKCNCQLFQDVDDFITLIKLTHSSQTKTITLDLI